uniref:Mating type 1-2-1 n=1 Tax=Haemonchus placei TaxID=6290 RepID=A0A0N4WKY2_HAEPC
LTAARPNSSHLPTRGSNLSTVLRKAPSLYPPTA